MSEVEKVTSEQAMRSSMLPGELIILLQNKYIEACGIWNEESNDYSAIAVYSITPNDKIVILLLAVDDAYADYEYDEDILEYIEAEAANLGINKVGIFINPKYYSKEDYDYYYNHFLSIGYHPTKENYGFCGYTLNSITNSPLFSKIPSTQTVRLNSYDYKSCDNNAAFMVQGVNEPIYGSSVEHSLDMLLSQAIVKKNKVVAQVSVMSDGDSLYIVDLVNNEAANPLNVLILLKALYEKASKYYSDKTYIWACSLTSGGNLKKLIEKIASPLPQFSGYPMLTKTIIKRPECL